MLNKEYQYEIMQRIRENWVPFDMRKFRLKWYSLTEQCVLICRMTIYHSTGNAESRWYVRILNYKWHQFILQTYSVHVQSDLRSLWFDLTTSTVYFMYWLAERWKHRQDLMKLPAVWYKCRFLASRLSALFLHSLQTWGRFLNLITM